MNSFEDKDADEFEFRKLESERVKQAQVDATYQSAINACIMAQYAILLAVVSSLVSVVALGIALFV